MICLLYIELSWSYDPGSFERLIRIGPNRSNMFSFKYYLKKILSWIFMNQIMFLPVVFGSIKSHVTLGQPSHGFKFFYIRKTLAMPRYFFYMFNKIWSNLQRSVGQRSIKKNLNLLRELMFTKTHNTIYYNSAMANWSLTIKPLN